jgi:hypothetical protein
MLAKHFVTSVGPRGCALLDCPQKNQAACEGGFVRQILVFKQRLIDRS